MFPLYSSNRRVVSWSYPPLLRSPFVLRFVFVSNPLSFSSTSFPCFFLYSCLLSRLPLSSLLSCTTSLSSLPFRSSFSVLSTAKKLSPFVVLCTLSSSFFSFVFPCINTNNSTLNFLATNARQPKNPMICFPLGSFVGSKRGVCGRGRGGNDASTFWRVLEREAKMWCM